MAATAYSATDVRAAGLAVAVELVATVNVVDDCDRRSWQAAEKYTSLRLSLDRPTREHDPRANTRFH